MDSVSVVADGGHQRLRGDLAAEDALQVGVGLTPAEEVEVELLEVEQLHQVGGGGRHVSPPSRDRGLVRRGRRGTARTELADLVPGRQRLVGGEQAGAGLLGVLEGVVLLLEAGDHLAHLGVAGQVAGDLLLALLGRRAQHGEVDGQPTAPLDVLEQRERPPCG